MSKKNGLLVGLLVAVAFISVSRVSYAQSTSLSTALSRMDEIIAQMNVLRAEFASLAAAVGNTAPAPQVQGAQSTIGFTESLEYGVTNDDIAWIQRLLATDPTIYPYGVDSGFFGPKTQEAIRNLQTRFGLDPVGVIGPATQKILEAFLAAFPNGNFPSNVLAQLPQVPQVQGATVTPNPLAVSVTPTTPVSTSNIKYIDAEYDRGEAEVRIEYTSGKTVRFIATGETESEIAQDISDRTGDDYDDVLAALDMEDLDDDDDDDADNDEGDAEDTLDEADEAVNDAEDAIDEADEDGEDVDDAEDLLEEAKDLLDEAEEAYDDEDWDEAVEKAEEAKDLAEEALEEVDGSSDDESDEGDAEDALDEADEAIEEAEDAIDEADEDGEDVDDAEDLLEEAKDLLDEAEEAYDDEDWDEAVEKAEEAKDLAEEALEEVD